jgi:aminopeptidase N
MRGLWGLLVLAGCGLPAAEEPPPPSRSPTPTPTAPTSVGAAVEVLDVRHYDADLRFDGLGIAGTVRIELDVPGDEVTLDADDLVVEEARVDGMPAAFIEQPRRDGAKLRVRVGSAGRHTLELHYHTAWERRQRYQDLAFTAFHTDRWLPCRMDPGDKATMDLSLAVPKGWTVAKAVTDTPQAAYLFGFVAGRFVESTARAGNVTLRFLVPEARAAQRADIFAATEPALDFFARVAGLPYPGSTYTQAIVPKTPGQELAGLSLLSDGWAADVLADPHEDWLVVHELAHSWWGNSVTCARWNDFWFQEALATFMTAAFKEVRWGRPAYDREIELAKERYRKLFHEGRDRPLAPAGDVGPDVGGPLPYAKGTLVLDALRTSLGDERFFEAIRRFTVDHAGGNASTADLQAAFAASGVDVVSFFDDYIYGVTPIQ